MEFKSTIFGYLSLLLLERIKVTARRTEFKTTVFDIHHYHCKI